MHEEEAAAVVIAREGMWGGGVECACTSRAASIGSIPRMEHIVGIVKARREPLIFTVKVLVAEVRTMNTRDNDDHWKTESDILQHQFNHTHNSSCSSRYKQTSCRVKLLPTWMLQCISSSSILTPDSVPSQQYLPTRHASKLLLLDAGLAKSS